MKIKIKTKNLRTILIFAIFTFVLFLAAIFKDDKVPEVQNLKNSVVAFAGNISTLAQNLTGNNFIPVGEVTDYSNIDIQDSSNRCVIKNGDIEYASRVNYLNSKIGYNPAEEIAGEETSDKYKEYFRGKNEQGIDLQANFLVAVAVKDGDDGINDAVGFVKGATEDGFFPIIRLCYEQNERCDFDLSQNENELVDYYQGISEKLKESGGNYVFAGILGPNEPLTGDPGLVISSFKVPNYETFIKRANEAADRLQNHRVENGGNLFLAPAIFNISQMKDAPNYLDGLNGEKIRPELYDFIAGNTYSDTFKDAYQYYLESGIPEYVVEHDLVTLITETGVLGISANDPAFGTTKKAQFLAMEKFCADDRIEGVSFFRNIKEFGILGNTVEALSTKEEEMFIFKDYVRLAETCTKGSKRMSLKNTVWLDCPVDSAIYSKSTDSKVETVEVAEFTATSKIGMNMSRNIGAVGPIKSDMEFAKSNALNGYIIELVGGNDPVSIDITAAFIKEANSRGLTPIIRLCYVGGGCPFNLSLNANSIVDFYTAVSEKAAGSTFVALLGPNEPGTGGGEKGFGEMLEFGISDYPTAVKRANEAAAALRSKNLSNIIMAPAAFNLINNENDDYKEYIDNGLDPTLFDVLIGNAYDEVTTTAYQVLQSKGILEYAAQNNLKVILTETGQIQGASTNFVDSAKQMCVDPNIAGILLFRAFAEINGKIDGDYAKKPVEFSNAALKEIGSVCNGTVTVGSGTGTGSTGSGLSSDILACGVENDRDDSFYSGKNGAALKVVCSGNTCQTKSIGTIEVEMPIKFMSSTASYGTVRNRVTPQAVETAIELSSGVYSALNTTAAEIQIGSTKYPMTGLGTYSNSVELSKVKGFERFDDVYPEPDKGSLISFDGIKKEIENGTAIQTVSSNSAASIGYSSDGTAYSLSSSTTCVNGRCYNHETEIGTEVLKTIIPSNPFTANTTIKTSSMCSTPIKYVNNFDDFVTGPEVIVSEKTEYSASSSETCWRYSTRYLENGESIELVGSGLISCGYDQEAKSPDKDKPDGSEVITNPLTGSPITVAKYTEWTCKELFDGQGTNSFGDTVYVPGGPRLPDCDFTNSKYTQAQKEGLDFPEGLRDGHCKIEKKYIQCMKYDQQPTDELYVYTSSYPQIDKVNIPNLVKEISTAYQKTKESLPVNRKLIIPEEDILGMKINVNVKMRDAYSPNNNETYLFGTQYNDEGQQLNLIDGKFDLAKNNPIKTQYQTFALGDGLVKQMQEIKNYYSAATTAYGDKMIDNPFYNKPNDPNEGRPKMLAGGISNVLMGTKPLLTCDQVNICKMYTNAELQSQGFSQSQAFELCPLNEKLDSDKKYTCITDEKDNRYVNDLESKLCEYGSDSKDCIKSCTVPSPTGPGGGGTDPGGGGEGPDTSGIAGLQCPLAKGNSCYQGAYGTFSHNERYAEPNQLPLDMVPVFGTGGDNDNPAKRDLRLFAPEDGTIGVFFKQSGSNGYQGYGITFKGTSGITYRFLHLTTNKMKVDSGSYIVEESEFYKKFEGTFVKAGTVIAEIGSMGSEGETFAYGNNGIHSHVTAFYEGQAIDPYYLYGEVLGCNVGRPDISITDGTNLFADKRNYCVSFNEGKNTLQDNNLDQISSKTAPIANSVVGNLLLNTYNGTQNSTVISDDLTLFPVGRDRPIPQCQEPIETNLVSIDSLPIDNNDVSDIKLTNVAAKSFNEMVNAMQSNDATAFADCAVAWGYVSAAQQSELVGECNGGTSCSCHSEHQLGTTVDFRTVSSPGNKGAFEGSACSNWLTANASDYGFIQSYTNLQDKYKVEPWHYRYIGKSYAQEFLSNISKYGYLEAFLESKLINDLPPGTKTNSSNNNYNSYLCNTGSDNNKSTNNIFELVEQVAEIVETDKYYLTAILTLESQPQMIRSVGKYIRDGTAIYKDKLDKADGAEALPNSASAQGPMQFICRTWMSYGYPKDYKGPRPCEPWSSDTLGLYYEETVSCMKQLGMEVESGSILDQTVLGTSLCAGAIKLKLGVDNDPLTNFNVQDQSTFDTPNGFWNNAAIYNFGGAGNRPPETLWYADSAWGRANYFAKFWEEYKSGEMGDDGSDGWYYYHIGLELPFCIDRNYGDQCVGKGATQIVKDRGYE